MCALAAQMAPLASSSGVDVVSLALAAYNAGSASVIDAGGIPQNGQTPAYVQRIEALEASFTITLTSSDVGQTSPPAGGSTGGASQFGLAVVEAGATELGVPYSWGGGNDAGPSLGIAQGTAGFDCSGLVLYAVWKASGGALQLPHSSEIQATLGQPVTTLRRSAPERGRRSGSGRPTAGGPATPRTPPPRRWHRPPEVDLVPASWTVEP